jgi:hypothetical protein
VLNGRNGSDFLHVNARPRGRIELDAGSSTDLDGNALNWEWFVYPEAGTYRGEISLTATTGPKTSFIAPVVKQPATIHVILRLGDNGQPPLCTYRRAVVTVNP